MQAARKPRGSARVIHQLQQEVRRSSHDNWALRHPEKARDERRIRKALKAQNDNFGHKRNGTAETHAKAAQVRQGSLARLYMSGALSADQLAWSLEIAAVHAKIGADVTVRTMSMETRVDQSRGGDGTFFEKLGQVRAEVAYTKWRADLPGPPAPILDMITNDMGVSAIAKLYRMDKRTARRLLTMALDRWPDAQRLACDEVDDATLLAAQSGIL